MKKSIKTKPLAHVHIQSHTQPNRQRHICINIRISFFFNQLYWARKEPWSVPYSRNCFFINTFHASLTVIVVYFLFHSHHLNGARWSRCTLVKHPILSLVSLYLRSRLIRAHIKIIIIIIHFVFAMLNCDIKCVDTNKTITWCAIDPLTHNCRCSNSLFKSFDISNRNERFNSFWWIIYWIIAHEIVIFKVIRCNHIERSDVNRTCERRNHTNIINVSSFMQFATIIYEESWTWSNLTNIL